MGFQKTYTTGGGAVASYNYTDIDEGTGITTYNGFSSEKSAGEQYGLTTATPFSHLVSSSGSLGTSVQFSGAFFTGVQNLPRLLKGTATISFTWRVTNGSGSNQNFPFVKLFKYDGTTSTLIAETSGSIINSAGGVMRTTCIKISDITTTKIEVGEQIELRVGITGADAGSTPKGFIAHDPQNRDDDWFTTGNFDTTKLVFDCPFKIDL